MGRSASWPSGWGVPASAGGRLAGAAAARAITAMSAGQTRQHPPAIVAPAAIHCRGCPAEYRDRPVQARRRASQSSPLLGYTITGLPVASRAAAMAAARPPARSS